MAAVTSQAASNGTLATPVPISPAASDTIQRSQFGPNGIQMRVITTGTATTVTVSDPGRTGLGNAGTPPSLTMSATGVGVTQIPLSAIDPASDLATVNFSGARTGVTYELWRI